MAAEQDKFFPVFSQLHEDDALLPPLELRYYRWAFAPCVQIPAEPHICAKCNTWILDGQCWCDLEMAERARNDAAYQAELERRAGCGEVE